MDFSKALELLKNGARIYREGWNGRGQHLELQVPDENSKMTLPYIFIQTVEGNLVPWLASQTDLLAEDWETELEEDDKEPEPEPESEPEPDPA